jgi:hypothetical protein
LKNRKIKSRQERPEKNLAWLSLAGRVAKLVSVAGYYYVCTRYVLRGVPNR